MSAGSCGPSNVCYLLSGFSLSTNLQTWLFLQLTVISCISSFRLYTITMILFYYLFIGKGFILHTVKLKKTLTAKPANLYQLWLYLTCVLIVTVDSILKEILSRADYSSNVKLFELVFENFSSRQKITVWKKTLKSGFLRVKPDWVSVAWAVTGYSHSLTQCAWLDRIIQKGAVQNSTTAMWKTSKTHDCSCSSLGRAISFGGISFYSCLIKVWNLFAVKECNEHLKSLYFIYRGLDFFFIATKHRYIFAHLVS